MHACTNIRTHPKSLLTSDKTSSRRCMRGLDIGPTGIRAIIVCRVRTNHIAIKLQARRAREHTNAHTHMHAHNASIQTYKHSHAEPKFTWSGTSFTYAKTINSHVKKRALEGITTIEYCSKTIVTRRVNAVSICKDHQFTCDKEGIRRY